MIELALIALSIGLHELAHGVVAHSLGAPVKQIVIGLPPVWRRIGSVGGVEIVLGKLPVGLAIGMSGEEFEALPRGDRVLVYLAGIAVNIALTAIFYALDFPFAALISFGLAATNILPIPPMDGGQAAMAVLGVSRADRKRATRIGTRLILACALATVVVQLALALT